VTNLQLPLIWRIIVEVANCLLQGSVGTLNMAAPMSQLHVVNVSQVETGYRRCSARTQAQGAVSVAAHYGHRANITISCYADMSMHLS
jgi:hypothetical protein